MREIDVKAARGRVELFRNFQAPEELRKNPAFRMIRFLQTSFLEAEGRYPTMEEVVDVIREKYGVVLNKFAVSDLAAAMKERKEAARRLVEIENRLKAGILLRREREGLRIENPKNEFLIKFLSGATEVKEVKIRSSLTRLAKAEVLCDPEISEKEQVEIRQAYEKVFVEIEERLATGEVRARTGSKPLWERLDDWQEAVVQGQFPNLGNYWEPCLTVHLLPVFREALSKKELSWFDKLVLEDLRDGESCVASAIKVNQQLGESSHGYFLRLQPQEIDLVRIMFWGELGN